MTTFAKDTHPTLWEAIPLKSRPSKDHPDENYISVPLGLVKKYTVDIKQYEELEEFKKLGDKAHEEHMLIWDWLATNKPGVLEEVGKALFVFPSHDERMLVNYVSRVEHFDLLMEKYSDGLENGYKNGYEDGIRHAMSVIISRDLLNGVDEEIRNAIITELKSGGNNG